MERKSFFLVFCVVLGLVSVNFSECNIPEDDDLRDRRAGEEVGEGSGEKKGERESYMEEILGREPQPGDCVVGLKELDLVFLIDVSFHVPFKAIAQIKEFIKNTLKIFDVEETKTRVSIIVSGDSNSPVLVLLTLQQGVTHRRIQSTLDNWREQGTGSFQLVPALERAYDISVSHPVRNVPKILIIVTASPITLSQQLTANVHRLTNNQFHLFVVSVGINDFGFKSLVRNENDHLVELSYYELETAVRINKTITAIPEYGCDGCVPNPCKNGGVCYMENLQSRCQCALTYSGPMCSISDPCASNPCPSNTLCISTQGNFVCYERPCRINSCLNGGTCSNTGSIGGNNCQCTQYYVGPKCEHRCPICYNGGSCRYDGSQQAVCSCVNGYEGTNCNNLVQPCSNHQCPNGFSCTVLNNSPVCLNPCDSVPCNQPHGTCVVRTSGEAVCICLTEGGFPPSCVAPVNPCDQIVCNNDGVCVAIGESAKCVCADSYTGKYCDVNPCDNWYKCLNGGTCIYDTQQQRPTCVCTSAYKGIDCSELQCSCQNQGVCNTVNGVNTCQCAVPYYGQSCELVNKCQPVNPCQNGGKCQDLPDSGSYACDCAQGYYGSTCSIELVSCSTKPGPCLNGASCVQQSVERYTCVCADGYTGNSCSQITNPCDLVNLCQNNSTCIHDPLKSPFYTCQCTAKYTGEYCNITVRTGDNACDSNPCKAPCVCKESCQHANGYICESAEGYLGKQCTIPPPTLSCGRDLISIEIPNELYTELTSNISTSEAFFYLGLDENSSPTPNCKAMVIGGYHILSIPSQFTDCQTSSMTSKTGEVSVVNKVWFNLYSNTLFDIPIPVFSIRCNYSTNAYDIVTSLQPIIDSNDRSLSETANKQYGGELQLCKNVGTCSSTCPSNLIVGPGAVYTIGQYINVIIKPEALQLNPNQPIILDDFFISCDMSPATSTVPVVTNGCATNQLLGTVSRSSTATCVTFKVHRLLACTTIYLHAKLKICPTAPTDCKFSSGLQCSQSQVNKRSLSSNFKRSIKEQIFGPIFIIPAPMLNDSSEFDIGSDNVIVKRTKLLTTSSKGVPFVLSVILGSLVGIVIILLLLVSIPLYRSYCKN